MVKISIAPIQCVDLDDDEVYAIYRREIEAYYGIFYANDKHIDDRFYIV